MNANFHTNPLLHRHGLSCGILAGTPKERKCLSVPELKNSHVVANFFIRLSVFGEPLYNDDSELFENTQKRMRTRTLIRNFAEALG